MIVFSFAACVDLFNTKVGRRCNGRIKLIKPIINNFKLSYLTLERKELKSFITSDFKVILTLLSCVKVF